MEVFSCGEVAVKKNRRSEVRGHSTVLSTPWQGPGRDAYALSVDSEWNESHGVNYLLSPPSAPTHDMKFSKLLPLPEGLHRKRSKTGSDIGPIEGQNEPDPAIPRPTESTPDLRTGTSTSPASSPSASRDQKSNGMQTPFFGTIHLIALFCATQPGPPFLIDSAPS